MIVKRLTKVFCLLILVVMTMGTGGLSAVSAQQGGTNLLVNGDFEWWDWDIRSWPLQDGIPEVQVCPGWRAFYVDNAPENVPVPDKWKRPEFRDVKSEEYAYRVHSGRLAQKYFTFGGQHIAGLYQQVGGITPGTPLRFSAYMETWSCMAGDQWNICPTGHLSNSPSPMHTKVGIDPTGGTNPWAGTVVWGPEINAYDVWTLFQVDAVAQNSTVTVFTYSYADWFDSVFRMHNDVYIDDASLVSLNELPPTATPLPAPTAEPAAPTATPQPTATPDPSLPTATPAPTATPVDTATPLVTATPLPDGAVIHTVQAGDTLSAIASRYQVPLGQIVQLNALADASVLLVGQQLVIVAPSATATPLPTDTATPLPPTPTATLLPPTATSLPPTPLPTATPSALATLAPVSSPSPSATPDISTDAPAGSWLWLGGIGLVIVILAMIMAQRSPRSPRF